MRGPLIQLVKVRGKWEMGEHFPMCLLPIHFHTTSGKKTKHKKNSKTRQYISWFTNCFHCIPFRCNCVGILVTYRRKSSLQWERRQCNLERMSYRLSVFHVANTVAKSTCAWSTKIGDVVFSLYCFKIAVLYIFSTAVCNSIVAQHSYIFKPSQGLHTCMWSFLKLFAEPMLGLDCVLTVWKSECLCATNFFLSTEPEVRVLCVEWWLIISHGLHV